MLRILVLLLIFSHPGTARASCGAASCPLDTASDQRREKGWVRLGYQIEYVDQDEHRMGRREADFGEVRGHHDEEYTVNRIHRLSASAGLTDRLSVDAQLPVISRSHSHVHHHHGQDLLERWDVSGVGDLALIGRYAFWKPADPRRPILSAIFGAELPTGRHHVDNAAGQEAESGVQPGSNSYDLILGASSLQTFTVPTLAGDAAELPLFASAQAQFNGPGTDDYRLGDTLNANLGTSYPVTRRLGVMAQLNLLIKDRDGIGRTGEEVGKTGGEFLYMSPGLEWRGSDRWRMFALIQLPVYQRVNSLQTVSDYNVLVGMECRFRFGNGL